MSVFKSWRSYEKFAETMKLRNRYIRDTDNEQFLSTVLDTSKSRQGTLKKDSYLWRAQIGYRMDSDGQPCAFPRERMKPQPNMASEGRANPKGIPYLYLATGRETAMAEVRPWVGSWISVGQFRIVRDIAMIDCTLHQNESSSYYFREPTPKKRELAVWYDINSAFSTPKNPSDSTAEYVPTQIIAELFKNNGFDGIVYKSALGKGLNIMVFDLNSAELVNCFLFESKEVSFKFEEIANPYFVRKKS